MPSLDSTPRSGRNARPGRWPRGIRYVCFAVAAVLTMFVSSGSQATAPDGGAAPPDQFTPLAASVLAEPHPVLGADGKVHLLYEILLINPLPVSTTIERLETLDGRRPGTILSNLTGPSLEAVMSSITGDPGRTVGAGQVFRAFMDVQLSPTATLPRSLVHRLTVTLEPPNEILPGSFLAGQTAVSTERPVVLGPPLQGRRWVHVNGCCDPAGHRIALSAVNGGLHLGQRFAIDLVQLDADGRLFTGPLDQVSSFPFYGTPVLSTASGVVESVRDDLPDQIPFQPTPVVSAATALGNNVVVNLGEGKYAMYAHLKPGSVSVAVGDRVRQGQQIGQLGNSGNSDFPHLHFQVMSSPSPLGSDGLPFVLRSFDSTGSIPPLDQIDVTQPIPIEPALSGHYVRVMPMNRQVVDYPSVR